MNRPDYSISTPENVDLHLELAGLGSRIWAAFVDITLVYLVMLVVIFAALIAAGVITQMDFPSETKTTIYYYLIALAILALFALQFGYFIFFEKLWQGQTPGKRIAQIRVIESNGQPVGWSSVIIRNLVRIVDVNLMMLGIIVMIFDRNERRLGDLLGGTLVIRERQPELSSRALRLNTAVPESNFVDSGQIAPDEYHLLVSFLRRRHQMNPASRMALAKQLADYFRSKLAPENKGESSETFLEKIYLAYSARAQEGAEPNLPARNISPESHSQQSYPAQSYSEISYSEQRYSGQPATGQSSSENSVSSGPEQLAPEKSNQQETGLQEIKSDSKQEPENNKKALTDYIDGSK